jgi:hypothetical protein
MDQPAQNTQPTPVEVQASAHSSDSSLREQALGHMFLGQLLAFMWQSGARDIEVLKSEDSQNLAIERFYWFGGRAGAALPDLGPRVSRHSKGNSDGEKNERPIHRVLTRGRFEALTNIGEVVERLFG